MNPDVILGLQHLTNTPTEMPNAKQKIHKGFGIKQHKSSFDEDEMKDHLKEQLLILKSPRQTLQKNLSMAEYLVDENMIKVTDKKGGYWAYLGHWDKGRIILHHEEALYMLECGVLVVSQGGVSWSLQQAYHTLLHDCRQLQLYQVFAHLKRTGFIVMKQNLQHSGTESQIDCVLNVYKATKSFKKTSPGSPYCVIIVARSCDPFPTLTELEELQSHIPQDSQLKCAVIENGDISFYSLYPLNTLPAP